MTEFGVGNIFCRTNTIDAGDMVQGHVHNFDHATFCTAGVIRVVRTSPDGVTDTAELVAGELPLLIKAECVHELHAVDGPAAYMCIYAHRTPQGEVCQRHSGWADGYN